MSVLDPDRAKLVPRIKRGRRPEYGHDLEFNRINRYGERASSTVLSELSLEDLEQLREHLNWYLDEGQYQE